MDPVSNFSSLSSEACDQCNSGQAGGGGGGLSLLLLHCGGWQSRTGGDTSRSSRH